MCPSYRIYVSLEDQQLFDEIYQALLNPQSVPSLWQDDEVVMLRDIQQLDLVQSSQSLVDSAFATIDDISFSMKDINFDKYTIAPTVHHVYTKFNVPYDTKTDKKQKRAYREVVESKNIVEFYNTTVAVTPWKLSLWHDPHTNYTISFY